MARRERTDGWRLAARSGARPHDADLQAVPHRIAAGEQRRPRGRADRLHVERLQPSARRREFVDVRRFDLAAVEADVGEAEIVGQEVDDVWARSRGELAE